MVLSTSQQAQSALTADSVDQLVWHLCRCWYCLDANYTGRGAPLCAVAQRLWQESCILPMPDDYKLEVAIV